MSVVWLAVCVVTCLRVRLLAWLCAHVIACLFVCVCGRVSVWLFVCVAVSLSVRLYVCVFGCVGNVLCWLFVSWVWREYVGCAFVFLRV